MECGEGAVELASPHDPALIESWFPYRELSLIARADRRARDPKYAAHLWWARRPAGVFRAILLASGLADGTDPQAFWERFESPAPTLDGLRVEDPFGGGGTTALEASRLGATAIASDVDPLAVEIIGHQLALIAREELTKHGEALIAHLRKRVGDLFPASEDDWVPLHYFHLRAVSCNHCGEESHLYRDLVIARDHKRVGSVVRTSGLTAFCPECFRVHNLRSPDRKQLRCCGRVHSLYKGTYRGQSFTCPSCNSRSTHRQLQTGSAPRLLIAVEETAREQRSGRRIREPNADDQLAATRAAGRLRSRSNNLDIPQQSFDPERTDERPISYGVKLYKDAFSDRQLLLFGHAFSWLRGQSLDATTRRALTLGVSNALASNNLLCGYARDYGRLSSLFSVRGYSLPALSVELNPLHPFAGRGTLVRTMDRIYRSADEEVTRNTWDVSTNSAKKTRLTFDRTGCKSQAVRGPANRPRNGALRSDLCIFDPPYFDYIAYNELSEFYRAWHRFPALAGIPLMPVPGDEVQSFARHMAKCLKSMSRRQAAGRPMVFTFHSSSADAWKAVGAALDQADMYVTALWPVKTDTHMGHHSHDGNCEWDLVIACRPRVEARPARCPITANAWFSQLGSIGIGASDREGMRLAVEMAEMRFGTM